MRFEEFYKIPKHIIYASATPDKWEIETAHHEAKQKKLKEHEGVVEQLIRPTGIIDPKITVRPASAAPASAKNPGHESEIQDLIKEIETRASRGEKVLVTTLTNKTAEELTDYLKEKIYVLPISIPI
jgi:excinuclease ABC subunit B